MTLQPPKKGRAQCCFHGRVCWRGKEGELFFLIFFLSFFPAGTLLAASSASLNDSKCQNHKNQDEVNQKNQEQC